MSEPAFVRIPSNEIAGAVAVNVFAVLSATALLSVICRVSWLAIRRCWRSEEVRECVFFNTQLGHYAACLIVAMIFNSIAGILGLRWTAEHGITEAWVCSAQAALMQIGNFATGFFTIAIAVHTFNSLVLKMRQSVIICRTTMSVGWTLSILIAVIPYAIHYSEGPIYGAEGLTCGIRAIFPKLQFALHVLPILLASVLGAVLYSLIFLICRGTIKYKQGIKVTLNPHERWNDVNGQGENYQRFIARVARSMLWYPVAYVAFLIPYAVTRLFVISGFTVPFEAVVFASVCYISLSFVDVLLLYNTFRVLGPAFDARSSASTSTRKMIESFGTPASLEKYGLSSGPDQRAALQEKIQHYRGQSGSSMTTRAGSELSFSTSSGKSTRPLLPLYLGGSDDQPMIGRSIIPASSQREIQPPARIPVAVRVPRQDIAAHIRNDSFSRGLPAPPRNRSPVDSPYAPEPHPPVNYANNAGYTQQWLQHQRSTQTFGHSESPPAKSPSLLTEVASDLEGSSHAHHRQASHPSASTYGQPMLSAVTPNFSPQQHSKLPPQSAKIERSASASAPLSAPSDRLRPLLLSRGSSPDMRASTRSSVSRYSNSNDYPYDIHPSERL